MGAKKGHINIILPKEKLGLFEGRVRFIGYNIYTKKIDDTGWIYNTVTSAGKVAILRRLKDAGTKSNEAIITYGVVGTGTTAPAKTDIKLVTELYRKSLSSGSITGTTLELHLFLTTTQGNGSIEEFGWMGEDASGSADTGTLFNRVLISYTKTTAKTLTIIQQFGW